MPLDVAEAQAKPAAQALHDVLLVADAKVPATHGNGALKIEAHAKPSGQAVQEVALASAYVPTLHWIATMVPPLVKGQAKPGGQLLHDVLFAEA